MASNDIQNKELITLLEKDGPFPLDLIQQESHVVYSVDHVHHTFLSLNGVRYLLITAFGRANTTGWTQPHLQPFLYFVPPQDGIWDFVFVATPPSGIAADIITPITANYLWKLSGFDLKGVRIHSATRTITDRITELPKLLADIHLEPQIGTKAA